MPHGQALKRLYHSSILPKNVCDRFRKMTENLEPEIITITVTNSSTSASAKAKTNLPGVSALYSQHSKDAGRKTLEFIASLRDKVRPYSVKAKSIIKYTVPSRGKSDAHLCACLRATPQGREPVYLRMTGGRKREEEPQHNHQGYPTSCLQHFMNYVVSLASTFPL